MNELIQRTRDWVVDNKGHAAVIAACAVLALAGSPVIAGLVGAGYIAYRVGWLDTAIAFVKAKIGG